MRKILLSIILFLASLSPALADNCSAYPFVLLNGVTADANQVMADFNNILSCGNNQLLSKNNNLSDVQSASTSRTNLGLGTAAQKGATDASDSLVVSVFTAVTNDIPVFKDGLGTVQDSAIPYTDILTKSGNLGGLNSASTSRTNLGLGSIATANVTYSTSGPSGAANAGDLWLQYVP